MSATALAVGLVLIVAGTAVAATPFRGLAISTPYPSQTVRGGEPVVINLTTRNFGLPPQVVNLRMAATAPGWRATFLAGGRVVSAVYVLPDQEATVTLRLEPPAGVRTGTHAFRVLALGEQARAELPLRLTLGEVLPVRLALEAEQPAVRGPATAPFRYRVHMRNESDRDLLVQLSARAPQRFQVTFSAIGHQVTSVTVRAGESRDIDVEVSMPQETAANTYHIEFQASAADTLASVRLAAEVTGRPDLQITAPEGRLSGRAYAGQETPLRVIVRNNGTAPVRGLTLSSSAPSGWDVTFEPERIDEIAPRGEVEVTARTKPSPRAISGDYMVTFTASAADASASADFRITVLTRTIWGIVGVALIAAALLVVGQAVARYGRR
jgi:uncharacterized membrane protein